MKRAKALARLHGRILRAYSKRTIEALRAALPLRLALPHLEPVLALNVEKEVEKDALVILRAREPSTGDPSDRDRLLAELMQATKDIDRRFLARVGSFPVEIVVRYDEIAPVRARRIKLLHDAASRIPDARDGHRCLRDAIQAGFSREDFARLHYELFRLYADETRYLSRAVRLPGPLVPLRELIARELQNVMLRVARPLAEEIASASIPEARVEAPAGPTLAKGADGPPEAAPQ